MTGLDKQFAEINQDGWTVLVTRSWEGQDCSWLIKGVRKENRTIFSRMAMVIKEGRCPEMFYNGEWEEHCGVSEAISIRDATEEEIKTGEAAVEGRRSDSKINTEVPERTILKARSKK